MKKNLIIFILTLASIISLIYGYTQKQKADQQEAIAKEFAIMAEEQKRQAELASMEALKQRKQAERAAELAREQMELALKHIQKKQNEAD